jgi:hypothetical protein
MEEGMLDPWYITGLVEGEGCFSVSFNLRDSLKVGIRIIELAYSMNPLGKRKYSKDFLLQVLGGEKV